MLFIKTCYFPCLEMIEILPYLLHYIFSTRASAAIGKYFTFKGRGGWSCGLYVDPKIKVLMNSRCWQSYLELPVATVHDVCETKTRIFSLLPYKLYRLLRLIKTVEKCTWTFFTMLNKPLPKIVTDN